jgi:phosphoglycerate dehydrogenase-like enzyme
LSGIALDVLANEAQKTLTWPEDSLVWQKSLSGSNILIAPHIGGGTYESMEDTEVFMANKLCDFIKRPAN